MIKTYKLITEEVDSHGDVIKLSGVDFSKVEKFVYLDHIVSRKNLIGYIKDIRLENNSIDIDIVSDKETKDFNINYLIISQNKTENKKGETIITKSSLNNISFETAADVKESIMQTIQEENDKYTSTLKWLKLQNMCNALIIISLVMLFFDGLLAFILFCSAIALSFLFGWIFRKKETAIFNQINKQYVK